MRFFIRTFGCQMNKADSELIGGLLAWAGHEPVPSHDEADIVIFNTCDVRAHAAERLFNNVRALNRWKGQGERLIAVGGCVAEHEGARLLERLPNVDIVFGTRNFQNLPTLIEDRVRLGHGICETDSSRRVPEGLPALRRDRIRAWVPIIRGCSNFCSYCVVPYVRGPEESRRMADVLHEVEQLAADGISEITLLGQNVNCYGNDLGRPGMFAELLCRLNEIESLSRIRFVTSHPKDLTDDIVRAVADSDKVCEYLHLPLQAGSDNILKTMNRRYTADEYLRLIERVRAAMPGAALSTDLIVGFPGETDRDFEKTLRLVEDVRFDKAFTFIYSPRPGTKAASLADQVPKAVKHERFDRLAALQTTIGREINNAMAGQVMEVLVEGASRRGAGSLAGRTRTNKVINFGGDAALIDKLVRVRVTAGGPNSCKGELCGGTG